MEPFDINVLLKGDQLAWDQAFKWLWPTSLFVAKYKLQVSPELIGDAEDIASESLSILVGRLKKCPWAKTPERVKALVASIASAKSIDHIRRHNAAKRGAGQIESIEETDEGGMAHHPPVDDVIAVLERAKMIDDLIKHLKPREKNLIQDFYLNEMSYVEISERYKIPVNSVGVYLKRGIATLNGLLKNNHGLKKLVLDLTWLPMLLFL